VELTGVPLATDLVVGKAGHSPVVPLRDGGEGQDGPGKEHECILYFIIPYYCIIIFGSIML
jgi:hypothetical protein